MQSRQQRQQLPSRVAADEQSGLVPTILASVLPASGAPMAEMQHRLRCTTFAGSWRLVWFMLSGQHGYGCEILEIAGAEAAQ